MEKLVSKTFNARVKFAINYYRQQRLLRGTKGENTVAHRTRLSYITGKNAAKASLKQKAENVNNLSQEKKSVQKKGRDQVEEPSCPKGKFMK